MAAATAVAERCPVCDLPHPCPTQPACLRRWADVMLDLLPDEDHYRSDPERQDRMLFWEDPNEE